MREKNSVSGVFLNDPENPHDDAHWTVSVGVDPAEIGAGAGQEAGAAPPRPTAELHIRLFSLREGDAEVRIEYIDPDGELGGFGVEGLTEETTAKLLEAVNRELRAACAFLGAPVP